MQSLNTNRIAKNTMMLYIRMAFMLLVTLYASRITLKVLGIDDFGINNIIAGIVSMFVFLTNAMTAAVQRFLTYELGRKNYKQTARIFSMSLTVNFCIVIIIVLLSELLGIWLFNSKLNIPPDRIYAAKWVYQFTIITFCLNIVKVSYNAVVIAYERMGIYSWISIFEGIGKLGVVFLLTYISADKLILLSILTAAVTGLSLLAYVICCKKYFDICNYKYFLDKKMFKELLSFSGWSLFGQLSIVFSEQGVTFLINIFYNVAVNAAMGLANQVSHAVVDFVGSFQVAVRPQITKSYAAGEFEYMRKLMFRTSKYSFCLLYILAIPLLFNLDIILQWWLGVVPEYTNVFVIFIVIHSFVECIASAFWIAIFAAGKIRNYQIIYSAVIATNIIFAYILLKMGYPPQYVIVLKILINILATIIRFKFAKKVIPLSAVDFLKSVILPIFFVVILTIPVPILVSSYIVTFWGVIGSSLIYILVIVFIIYFICLDEAEKKFVKGKIINISHFINK